MTWLLDGNVLSALLIDSHEHHRRAFRWFDSLDESFATCTITQGTLLRVHMAMAADHSASAAWAALSSFVGHSDHVFWEEGFCYTTVPFQYLQTPRQVTDAWLAELARRRGGKVATLDVAFATLYPKLVTLVPI